MTVSLCMIVKNEEATLGRCLESVKHIVDEMIVVDTGSTDLTEKVAKSYGARVFYYPWDGSFSNARNFAIAQAEMDWILVMDADEEFEQKDTDKFRGIISGEFAVTAYYCKILSFLGNAPDTANVLCSLGIRIFKNRMSYWYADDTCEQLRCSNHSSGQLTAITDMRIYHYGYLGSAMRTQEKRQRCLNMISKELEKHPDNPFMLYNLGNEYFSLQQMKDACDCYIKSYSRLDASNNYSARLLLRLATCFEMLGKTEEALKYIDEGLAIFPDFTDLEFTRGCLLLRLERYFAAVKSFKKCICMGEAPLPLRNTEGTGTYKPAFMLFQIHHNLGDPKGAMRYARMTLKFIPQNQKLCSHMASLLINSLPPGAASKKIIRLLPSGSQKYLLLSDACYAQRRYEQALKLSRRAEKSGCDKTLARYNQGVCLFYLKRYGEAYKHFKGLFNTPYGSRAAYLCRLSAMFDKSLRANFPDADHPYSDVLERFEALLAGKSSAPLPPDDASSEPYVEAIFSLLEVLMKSGHFEEFNAARKLLGLVTDDTVLMRLGKLFFRFGYLKLAYRELERSIRLTGVTDGEALRMMKYILDNKALE